MCMHGFRGVILAIFVMISIMRKTYYCIELISKFHTIYSRSAVDIRRLIFQPIMHFSRLLPYETFPWAPVYGEITVSKWAFPQQDVKIIFSTICGESIPCLADENAVFSRRIEAPCSKTSASSVKSLQGIFVPQGRFRRSLLDLSSLRKLHGASILREVRYSNRSLTP
jgi:hypothetical protein